MKLYGYFRSSAAYRVRIALGLKGLAWETELVDLRAPVSAQHTREFRTLNPHGLIPVLADAGHVLTQSLAIIAYLEETHPQQRRLRVRFLQVLDDGERLREDVPGVGQHRNESVRIQGAKLARVLGAHRRA